MRAPERLSLQQSVRRFWYHLVPITLFGPCVATVSTRAKGEWVWPITLALFFAVAFFAMWPTLTKRATYRFWILACTLYLVGGVLLTFIAAPIVNLIFGAPTE